MESPTDKIADQSQVVFRTGKKRKIYRQRADESALNLPSTGNADSPRPPTTRFECSDEITPVITEAQRQRNARRIRLGGVVFGRTQTPHNDGKGIHEHGVILHESDDTCEDAEPAAGGISQRFAPRTGLVGELVNKHMEDYIASELARRKQQDSREATAVQQGNETVTSTSASNSSNTNRGPAIPADLCKATASAPLPVHNKLQEIDLGEETRARNVAMTERARRRLQGCLEEDEQTSSQRTRKIRVGRDGKPWRPRNRRGSDDIKRDQLVEEFLRENRLDVYNMPAEAANSQVPDDDRAADDRIADEFQREFYDAMTQRRKRKKLPTNAKPGPKTTQKDVLKGPKLGGSRNTRAAMRDLLLKEQKKKR